MDSDKLSSLLARLFFFGAFMALALAVLMGIGNIFGYEIRLGHSSAGRLLEFGTIQLIVVTVLLLRQVREALKKRPG